MRSEKVYLREMEQSHFGVSLKPTVQSRRELCLARVWVGDRDTQKRDEVKAM